MLADRPYLFSVVMPVYNVEPYLAEAIESVVDQTIGFESHIQLILVNDGSTDGSGAICETYAKRYPENIVYVVQENGGVSAARNKGMSLAAGRYVNFLDSDDKWGLDAFEIARDFFEQHPDAGVLSFPMFFFEARTGEHHLNYKCKTTRIIDLNEEPKAIQKGCNHCFFERSVLAGHAFDARIRFSQDMAFVGGILLEHQKLGVSAEGAYWYRKRDAKDSAVDRYFTSPEFFTVTPELVHRVLFERSLALYGKVLPFLQFAVMDDFAARLKHPDKGTLDDRQLAAYKDTFVWLLQQIDDDVIAAQRAFPTRLRLYAYALKYGVLPQDVCQGVYVSHGEVRARFGLPDGGSEDVLICSTKAMSKKLHINTIELRDGCIALQGKLGTLSMGCPIDLRFSLGKASASATLFPANATAVFTPFGDAVLPQMGFEAAVPCDLSAREQLTCSICIGDFHVPADLSFGPYAGLTERAEHSFCRLGKAIARFRGGQKKPAIVIERASLARCIVYERSYQKELAGSSETSHLVRWRKAALWENLKKRLGPSVWLIVDHVSKADDNGEALFRYLHDHPIKGVHPVFCISASSPDFERMQRYGTVVDADSDEAKRMFLRADVLLGSYPYAVDVNPFGSDRPWISDRLRHHFVFLQHGVIFEDLSGALHKALRNTELFVTSAPRERAAILGGDYGYTEDEVVLTGLPRHDSLLVDAAARTPSRRLYIMPTWRKELANNIDFETKTRPPFPGFSQTEYYRFYQSLLQSPRLADMLERYDYEARFVLHPNFLQEAGSFSGAGRVQVLAQCNYHEAFLDASCLLTDYSSVFFDVALLKRPIIYAQFDADTFFKEKRRGKDYFSFEEDGFGPVCHSLDETLDAIEEALQADGVMAPEYQRRVDEFFFRPEKPRCELVCDAVQERFGASRWS